MKYTESMDSTTLFQLKCTKYTYNYAKMSHLKYIGS